MQWVQFVQINDVDSCTCHCVSCVTSTAVVLWLSFGDSEQGHSRGKCEVQLVSSWCFTPSLPVRSPQGHVSFGFFVGWLITATATCLFISWTHLLRQLYVLPHWDRSCRSNQSQYTDTRPTSPSADPIKAQTGIEAAQAGIEHQVFRYWGGRLNH